ncbi:MAG: hypothetical protein NT075_31260, partial [Chloroflexi bacterium]|nr:hypothetical protein [Chloroflexota bacterium]
MMTNLKMRIVGGLLINLMLIVCFASCTGRATPVVAPEPVAQGPTVVRIGWKGGPDTMNPGMAFLTDAYTIFNLVYDTMYELNLDNTFRLS